MSELTTSDRLQPSLLDRLTDHEPGKKTESRDRRVMSMRQLREAVLRDLEWLLNARSMPRSDELWEFPRVAASVVNFGIPDLTGTTASGLSTVKLERTVRDAIANFEPRIVPGTLQVAAGAAEDITHGPTSITFEIGGDICPLPIPEALYVRTEVDLETGRAEVKEK